MNTIAIKAGMDKIDKAKVEAIIEKMSRDSPHYEKVWIGPSFDPWTRRNF